MTVKAHHSEDSSQNVLCQNSLSHPGEPWRFTMTAALKAKMSRLSLALFHFQKHTEGGPELFWGVPPTTIQFY